MTVTTITGATLQEYVDQRAPVGFGNEKTPPETKEPKGAETDSGAADDATKPDAESGNPDPGDEHDDGEKPDNGDGEKPAKPVVKGKVSERMAELTRQRRAAEERADAAERKLAEKEKAAPAAAGVVADPTDPNEPSPDRFPDAVAWASAVINYRVDKRLNERDARAAAQHAQTEAQKVQSSFKDRMDAVIAARPEFEEKLMGSAAQFHDDIRDYVMPNERGPEILEYLVDHPKELNAINAMGAVARGAALGRIEAKLPAADGDDAPVVERKMTSRAPEPINPLRSPKSSADLPISSKGEWTGTYKQFKAAVEAGKIR